MIDNSNHHPEGSSTAVSTKAEHEYKADPCLPEPMLVAFERSPSLSELKISYRRKASRTRERPAEYLRNAKLSENYLRRLWDQDTLELREEVVLVCLSAALEATGWVKLHTGGLMSSSVDLRLLLSVALQTASCAIIVAHNHPSGTLTPSQEDQELTGRIAKACRLIGIRLVDHLILTRNGAYSFSENEPWNFEG